VQNIEAVCKRLRNLMATPGDDRTLWGSIVITVSEARPTLQDLMQMIPWLMQRAAGNVAAWPVLNTW
jgi:hypothetical protein